MSARIDEPCASIGVRMEKCNVPTRIRPNLLSDENIVTVGAEPFRARVLFQPYFTGTQARGIHDTSFRSATWISAKNCTPMSCCQVARPCSKGLVHDGKIDGVATPTMKIMVFAPPERKHSVSVGGSILSSLSTFLQVWISKGAYGGSYPTIAHRKCF